MDFSYAYAYFISHNFPVSSDGMGWRMSCDVSEATEPHFPILTSLHLRLSSFNPSVASPTS